MVHVSRAARLTLASIASVLALVVVVAAPPAASADPGAMVVPITSIEGVTGQVGAYCHSGLPHGGVDISANTGDPVYAAYGGTLQRLTQASYGTHIIITSVDGYSTVYAHLSGYAAGAPDGSTVSTGQLIGYAGTTGNSTGVHLHFEVRLNGVTQSGINAAFPCGSHTVALTPIAWTFPGLPAVGPEPLDNLVVYRPVDLHVLRTGGERVAAALDEVRHHRRPAGRRAPAGRRGGQLRACTARRTPPSTCGRSTGRS